MDQPDQLLQIQALQLELRKLRSTLDHVGAYVFTKDREGRYTYANDMVCQLFGRPLEQVVGTKDEEYFNLEISNELRINDRLVLDQGQRIEVEETNVIAGTGATRTYWSVKLPLTDDQGQILGMCGISTDITERLALERKAKEQKQILDSVLSHIEAHVYLKDKDRRYLYANDKMARRLGLSKEKILGKLDEDLMDPAEALPFAQRDLETLLTGKMNRGEEAYKNWQGKSSTSWSIRVPLVEKGQVQALVGISTDITELVQLKEKLAQANATKDQFFSIIAHDLKGPVGSMAVIFNEIIKSPADFTEEILQLIRRSSSNLHHLLLDLLDWARPQSGHLQPQPVAFDLADKMAEVAKVLALQAEQKGILCQVVSPLPEAFVWADSAMITTVIRNLISNAIKFTTTQGKITLSVIDMGGTWELSIEDTGVGISDEVSKRLFDPAEKISSSLGTAREQGTGLGLIMCREFVVKNQGGIGVESQLGQGSRFYFRLPKGKAPEFMGDAWKEQLNKIKILVAEDDPLHRQSTQKMLETYHCVGFAEDGLEAIELTSALEPDLVLMDIDLPKLDGIAATAQIRSRSLCPWVVALTSMTPQEIQSRNPQVSFDGFLAKPLDKSEFLTLMQRLLSNRYNNHDISPKTLN